MKIRLDQYLVQHGLTQSRERAKALIMSGIVFVNEQKVDKAGEMIKEDAKVEVRGHDIGYVSRGGLKLEKAMKCFPLTPNGKVCMDIGASTGAERCRQGLCGGCRLWTACMESAHRRARSEHGAHEHPQCQTGGSCRADRVFQCGCLVYLAAPYFPGGTGNHNAGCHGRLSGQTAV